MFTMNMPKEVRSYCPTCKSHQTMKVSIYKAGKRRGMAAGERSMRYEKKDMVDKNSQNWQNLQKLQKRLR